MQNIIVNCAPSFPLKKRKSELIKNALKSPTRNRRPARIVSLATYKTITDIIYSLAAGIYVDKWSI